MPEPTPELDHVGLNVADLEAAAAWYGAAFGYRRELDLHLAALDLHIVMLISSTRRHRLELLHRPASRPGLRAANPAEAVLTQGFGHLAFEVPDVDAAVARLVALGAGAVMAPQPSPEPGVRMAFVSDPEGNLLELLDRSSGAVP